MSNRVNRPMELFPHQKEGVEYIRDKEENGGIWALFDDCGTGKTMTVAKAVEGSEGPTLVLCPASIKFQWEEAFRHLGLSESTNVESYATMSTASSRRSAILAKNYLRVVLDEAHLGLGQLKRNRRRVLYMNSSRGAACMQVRATYRGVLTATPVVSSIANFHAIAHFLRCSPETLSSLYLRRKITVLPSGSYPRLMPRLHCVVRDQDYVDSHDVAVKAYVDGICGDAPPEAAAGDEDDEAAAAERKRREQRYKSRRTMNKLIGEKLLALDSAKRCVMGKLLEECGHDDVLVFTELHEEQRRIREYVKTNHPSRCVVVVNGTVPASSREELYRKKAMYKEQAWAHLFMLRFHGDLPRGCLMWIGSYISLPGTVMLMQEKCGSVGLNLSRFRSVIFVNPGWCSIGDYQRLCRVRRMDSPYSRVDVHWICTKTEARGYIDRRVASARLRKIKAANAAWGDDRVEPLTPPWGELVSMTDWRVRGDTVERVRE